MFPFSVSRRNFQNSLSPNLRLNLERLTAALAAKGRREGAVHGDSLQFLENSINRAAPGLPPAFVQALTRYVITDPIFQQGAASHGHDQLSDLSTQEQWQLQHLLVGHSRAYKTLSNLMKKLADTARGIVGNLK
jgi:hypothetical protein